MKTFTLALIASLAFIACKEEKVAARTAAATVVGELQYRDSCTGGFYAPVGPFQISPLNAGPFLYLTDAAGARVGDVSTTDETGKFRISGIPVAGTYYLNLLMGELDRFYREEGTSAARIPVVISALTSVSAGKVCADNEAPRLESVLTTWADHAVTTAGGAVLHLLQSNREAAILAVPTDADGDTVRVDFTAAEGTLIGDGSTANWLWNETTRNTALTIELSDRFGGYTRIAVPVQMHDSELAPTYVNLNRVLNDVAERQQLLYTADSEDAMWSSVGSGLTPIINPSLQQVHMAAVAPELLPASNSITVSATVNFANANGDVRMGVFLGRSSTSGTLALVVRRGSELAQWELRDEGRILANGRLAFVIGGTFALSLTLDPKLQLATWTVGVNGTDEVHSGAAGISPFDASETLQAGIVADSNYVESDNMLSGIVENLSVQGGSRTGYRVPFRHGSIGNEEFGIHGIDYGYAIIDGTYVTGMADLNIEMGSYVSLEQVLARSTLDDHRLTALIDSIGSVPEGYEVVEVTPDALVVLDVGGNALY